MPFWDTRCLRWYSSLLPRRFSVRVAARYGVRSGHLLPVPDFTIALFALGLFPSSWLIWPFGILLLPSMPRMDARPWPNRASLGFTALSVPVVLGVAGGVLMVLGISMTPEYLASSTMPLVSDTPLFLSLLASGVLESDAYIRLLWAHPWVHVGGMMMLFAWISILPVPTFPGGRILIARMGLLDARSSSTQSLILVLGLFLQPTPSVCLTNSPFGSWSLPCSCRCSFSSATIFEFRLFSMKPQD